MKRVFPVVALACLVAAALGHLYSKSSHLSSLENGDYGKLLSNLRLQETTLNYDILRARVRTLKHYDGLSAKLVRMEELLSSLEEIPPLFSEKERLIVAEKVRTLKAKYLDKAQLVEDFKSQNSILNNSLRWLPTAEQRLKRSFQTEHFDPSLESDVSDLLDAVQNFSLFPSEDLLEPIEGLIDNLDGWVERNPEHPLKLKIRSLSAHAASILQRKPVVDRLTDELLDLQIRVYIQDLRRLYNDRVEVGLQESSRHRLALFTFCGILLSAIAGLVIMLWHSKEDLELRVEERTRDLVQKREELEQEIEVRQRIAEERDQANRELVKTSRMAGMAEIASNVLHNVGNVLNSVNVSANLVARRVRKSRGPSLNRICKLMAKHQGHLGEFIASDPKGKQIPDFLEALDRQLAGERDDIAEELGELTKNIEHIKEIVSMQQSYSSTSGAVEEVDLVALIREAIKMSSVSLEKHEIELVEEIDCGLPLVSTDRHKVLQIFINLLRNAKQACLDSGNAPLRIVIRVTQKDGQIWVSVADNGVGIASEHAKRIFNHGFTTKKEGHGFGLHSGANTAREIGGSLDFDSEGLGKGATFTLKLPVGERVRACEAPLEREAVWN